MTLTATLCSFWCVDLLEFAGTLVSLEGFSHGPTCPTCPWMSTCRHAGRVQAPRAHSLSSVSRDPYRRFLTARAGLLSKCGLDQSRLRKGWSNGQHEKSQPAGSIRQIPCLSSLRHAQLSCPVEHCSTQTASCVARAAQHTAVG